MLRTIANSLMVYARVLEDFIHLILMYTANHIFPALPIKDLINEYGNPTTPYKLATGMKPSILHLRVLFFPYVVRKSTAHIGEKLLNMRHQAQKGFHFIFSRITQHQKGCLVYVPYKQKVVPSYGVVFYKLFSSVLVYTSQLYAEAMDVLPAV